MENWENGPVLTLDIDLIFPVVLPRGYLLLLSVLD